MSAAIMPAAVSAESQPQQLRAALSRLKCLVFHLRAWLLRVSEKLRSPRVHVFHLDPALARKAEAVAWTLNRHGIQARVVGDLSRQSRLLLKGTTDLWIGLWNSVPLELLPKRFIFWNGEPTMHRGWDDNDDWQGDAEVTALPRWHEAANLRRDWLEAARRSLAVWGYVRSGEAFAQSARKPFTFVPFGYSPYYEHVFAEVNGGRRPEQDIDVLFFGWSTERRKRILVQLSNQGVNLVNINEHRPVRGAELEKLIARAKIVLGIFGYDDATTHVPDLARFDFVFSNRVFALHERPSEFGRDDDFEAHVPVRDHSDIVAGCMYYLAHPEEREEAAKRTYEWFKSQYALESFMPTEAVRLLRRENPLLT